MERVKYSVTEAEVANSKERYHEVHDVVCFSSNLGIRGSVEQEAWLICKTQDKENYEIEVNLLMSGVGGFVV